VSILGFNDLGIFAKSRQTTGRWTSPLNVKKEGASVSMRKMLLEFLMGRDGRSSMK
jgi:hypothetical protein